MCCGHHSSKGRTAIRQENQRIVEFHYHSALKDKNTIALDDCVEAMSNGQDGTIFKSFTQRLLYQRVRLSINGRRGLIQ